jgi:hypothetical protein
MSARNSLTADEAQRVGEEVGIDWTRAPFDVEQFRKGMNVELEHGLQDSATNVTGDDPKLTARIALAHLNEFPDYYTRLEQMEREAKGDTRSTDRGGAMVDEFLPVFDVSDGVAVVVAADAPRTWDALMEADLIEVGRRRPLVGLLGAARMLPDVVWNLLHGEHPAGGPERLTLRDTATLPMRGGGWVLLDERPSEEIALGLVGKFWRPVIEFAEVDASAFEDFSVPGYAKTVYALGTRQIDPEKTLLWATMRTATTDEYASRWFRRYWTLGVGSGAHVLVAALLDVAREKAESSISSTRAAPRPAPDPLRHD